MASEAAVAALHSNSVFVECGGIGPLAMPLLLGWDSLSAEKKARWYGRSIICAS